MHTYSDERLRRIAQFAHHIRLMDERTHKEVESSCFLIFNEEPNSPRAYTPALDATKTLKTPLTTVARDKPNYFLSNDYGVSNTDGHESGAEPELPSEPLRFVQFYFDVKTFSMDLPATTLFSPELGKLLRDRAGFAKQAQLGRVLTFYDHVKMFDPVCKEYLYGDEQSAAEDAAYIFFDLWRFPVDACLYVTAAAFNGPHRWEQGYPTT